MAQSYQAVDGLEVVPRAYARYSVQATPSGLATTGVIAIIGEAAQGPDFTQEQDLQLNAFGPSSLAEVVAKYGSGNIVNAFQALAIPSKDPNITGSPQSIIVVKTNAGGQATGNLTKVGSGVYAALVARSEGVNGNLINFQVVPSVAEVAPTTGAFTLLSPAGTVNVQFRVDGSTSAASSGLVAITAAQTPASIVSSINSSIAGSVLTATGGTNRGILKGTGGGPTLALVASGNNVVITYSTTWNVMPVIGDSLNIPHGSSLQDNGDASDANVGSYVVTGVTTMTINATKMNDAGASAFSPVPGVITAPETVTATAENATTDLADYSPVTISNTVNTLPLAGVGKTLEIADLATGTDLLVRNSFQLASITPVTFIQGSWAAAGVPTIPAGVPSAIIDSVSEYAVTLNVASTIGGISESFTAGGKYGLTIGYTGTSALCTVSATSITLVTTGGSNPGTLVLGFAQYPTIASLVSYINAQVGYTCSVGNVLAGQLPTTNLDQVTNAPFATSFTGQGLNLKMDAALFFQAVSASQLVQENNPAARALAGIPATNATIQYLAGGSLGSTSNANIAAALTALQAVTLNFIVPLFSQDAVLDSAAGLTDPSSSYTIDAINAQCLSHCILMSETRYQQNRQCFLSYLNSFDNCLEEAANLASFRSSLAFENFIQINSQGNLQQFQPWMGASLAAGMQAAGFYKAIVNKEINTTGTLMADGSFNPRSIDQVTQALQGGLLPAAPTPSGSINWVSDQTTYGVDNNFVFNSIQAVYAADIITITTAQQMTQQFVGQSLADVTAPLAESAIEGIMANFLRLKLIAPSTGAPKGFQNVVVNINAPVMTVSLQVFLATALYFVDITFTVAPVSQSAAS